MAKPRPLPTETVTTSGSVNSTGSMDLPLDVDSSFETVVDNQVIVIGKKIHHPPGSESPLYPGYESRESTSEEQIFEERETWTNKVEFIMACVSMSVGLGNIWRFPFTALNNGGGAFLIPYFIFLFGIGKPISVVSMSLGQFSTRGPVSVWDMVPILRGVGYCTLIISGSTLTYISAILSFCVVYLIHGMSSSLPWASCDETLYERRDYIENLTCQFDPALNVHVANESTIKYYKSNSELYFQYTVAKQLEHIEDGIGVPDIQLVVSLAFVWALMFVQFSAGTKSTGKVSYFTACFPHIVLMTLLVRASLLDGAVDGIVFFFKPDWDALFTFRVWKNALSQAFFSLAVGYGTMIYGSYNPFRQHIKVEAIIVGIADCFTSLLAGVTVFAVLGVLAQRKHIPIEHLAQGDMGLAFITYPEVLSYFGPVPMPQIFSFIFFAMLLSLGVGSSAGYLHPIVATLYELQPSLARSRCRKVLVIIGICLVGFLLGIVYTTPGGIFVIHLVDEFLTGIVLYMIICCELVGLFWFYGVKNYIQDMEFMLETKCPSIFRAWCYFVPFFMVAVGIYTLIDFDSPIVHVNYEPVSFPRIALKCGYVLAGVTVALIPLGAIFVFFTRRTSSCKKRVKACFCPNRKWGPRNPDIKKEWEIYKKRLRADPKDALSLYQITIGRLLRRKPLEDTEIVSGTGQNLIIVAPNDELVGNNVTVRDVAAATTAIVGTSRPQPIANPDLLKSS
ncbi:unnamed protein product [Allacma fusca]|uniref:Transporter n=1 Tax=Allacma fusca TaxID=39272 RepID=A0A8J2NPZ4_9HEXA|nr:unnamed protein product [Allacma fusca]